MRTKFPILLALAAQLAAAAVLNAMFIRHVQTVDTLSSLALLKLSVFAHLYGSPDLCHFCLAAHDRKFQSDLCALFWRSTQ